jgi:DNA polymerase IV
MDRQIICFAVPSFELALVRLNDSTLRTRPLALAPFNTPRALLHDVSPEAKQDGLHIGMPLEHARRLCPSLHVLSPNPYRVRSADQSLMNVVAHYTPVWEPARPGAFIMDVTGTARLFGPACDVVAKVQQEVFDRYRLDGLAGVGGNKLVAQTAARLIEPSELYEVRPGSERHFMAPLSVLLLPGLQRPCMRKVLERLDDLNLRTLGEVAESPLDALELAVGDYARTLYRWAQGIDHVPVLPPARQPSLEEIVALEPDEVDDSVLMGRLLDALQGLCRTLRSQRRVCGSLALTIRYSDQLEVTKRERINPETCWECDLSPIVSALFRKCVRRRIRLQAMTLIMTGLTAYAEQVSLFDDRPLDEQRRYDRAKKLALALDQLQARYGEGAIHYGRNH